MTQPPQWPPIPPHEGYRYEFIATDQSPSGLAVLKSYPINEAIDHFEHGDKEGKGKDPKAAALLRELTKKDGYFTHQHFAFNDIDGDGQTDFYFWREYEQDKLGLELFLSQSVSFLEGINPERIKKMMTVISKQHPVQLIAMNGMTVHPHPLEAKGIAHALMTMAEGEDYAVNRFWKVQEKLQEWNALGGPDGVLVLDPSMAPAGYEPDLLPGTPEYQAASEFIRQAYILEGHIPFIDENIGWEGSTDPVKFPLAVEGKFPPDEVMRWKRLIREAFALFLQGDPAGKVLAHPDVTPKIRFTLTRDHSDMATVMTRLRGFETKPDAVDHFDAITEFAIDENNQTQISSVEIVINDATLREHFASGKTPFEYVATPDLYAISVLIKEFNNITHFVQVGGTIRQSRGHGQYSTFMHHLRRVEKIIAYLKAEGREKEAKELQGYYDQFKKNNDEHGYRLLDHALVEHHW